MTLENIDRGVSVLMGAVCTAVVISGLNMGGDAGVFPVIAGSLGILACLILGVGALLRHTPEPAPARLSRSRLTVWCLCLIGLMLMMPIAGTFATLPLFMVITLRVLAGLRWRVLLLIALGFTTAIYVIFQRLLDVPLPAGLLGA